MESLTRPAHRRKLSNASGVFSFSSKNVYDDVFAVPSPAAAAPAPATKFKAPVGVETYGEIFGSSRGSSIPVLDLSVLKDKRTGLEDHRSCSKLDYAKIFGGFGDEVTAVPYEELFAEKGKKCSSDKAVMNGKESPLRGSDNHSLSEKDKGHSSEASDQSIDAVKQVNMSYHKSSQRTKDGPSGTRHVAKLQAIPGFTYFIDETDRQQKAEGDRPVPSTKNDVQRACSFNTHEKNNGNKTEMPMPNTVRQQKTEGDRPVPSIKSEVQRTWSFSGNIQEENNGRKTEMLMPNIVHQQKTEGDRPVPSIKSEVQRTWSFSGNIQEENNGRKTEMPVPNILITEGVNKGKRGSWWDGSRSNDKLFSSGEISCKSHSFKSSMSSTPPAKLNDIKGHPKRSRSLSFASKANASEKSGDYLTGSSDEELDMNSAAAASAAALKKVIEQAQESIRLAKELMERKNDGSQGHSNPISKARDRKESRTDRDANNIKKNSAQETYERFDNVFQGSTGKNRKPTLQTNEVAAPSVHNDKISASRRVEVEKHQNNVVEIHETKAWLSDLGNYGNDRSMTFATGQIQNKITTKDKQACDIDEIKKSEETLSCMENNVEKTKVIEHDFVLGNAESRNNVHQEAQESKETANKFNSAHMLHECGGSEDTLIGDIRNGFDELEESEEKFQECLDIIEEEKLVPPRLADQNLVEEEKVPDETFQGRNMETEPEKDKENDTELRNNSSEGGGMVNEEACLFVEEEDKPIAVIGDRSNEKAHEDTREGEHSERSHPIEGKDVDEMVVIHAHKKEGTRSISEENLKDEEAEELDLNEMELTDAHDGNKSRNILSEEQEGGEVPRGHEETYHYSRANQNIPEEAFEHEEVEKKIEEAYLDEATESLWIEADKSTENQKAEVTQEAEEAESVHLEAENFDNNQDIGSLQKAACERNSDTAFGTLREVQEPSRFDVSNENEKTSKDAVENYEDNCGAPAVNEALYQCERDADEEEESVKEASELEKETSETGHCVQHANQEYVIPSGMQSDSEAVASDENGANVHCNEINHAHTLSKENTFEAVDFRNAVKENDTNIKMQDASKAHLCDEKAAQTGSSENSRHKEIEENVEEESSFNPYIFDGLVHNSGENPENVNKEAEVAFDKEERDDVKVGNKERNMEEYSEEAKSIPLPSQSTRNQVSKETYKEMKTAQNMQHAEEFFSKTGAVEEKELRDTKQNGVKESNETRKIEANKREREWNTDRIAVERVIREARERAFAEARERAERAAVERASTEVRQRVMAEARGKLEKTTTGSKADKASSEAKLKAERAAVERATAEARERALEKALSHKSSAEARVQAEKLCVSRDNGLKHSFSSSDLENLDGTSSESAQRRKARLERHQRIMERAAKALEEKNTRDRLAQKEQAERNRLAETLDADVKRWASGKERNLRALLSTLQYILGPDSGWQPISLTEIITTVDVKKAYRKATLCVHPDKLQQRGASIHQKYICEKVFDLLKAAWNRFNSEER